MKRVFGLLMTLVLTASLVACGSSAKWQEQYDLGIRYLSEGNYKDAIMAFTNAIEIDDKQPLAYIGRGDAYFSSIESKENLTAALADYENAAELDDTNADVWMKIGETNLSMEQYQEAAQALEHAAEIAPERAEIQEKRGDAYAANGEQEAAKEAYELALDADPTSEVTREKLGKLMTAEYQISKKDFSYKDKQGKQFLKIRYDMVEVSNCPGSDKINGAFAQLYKKFEQNKPDDDYADAMEQYLQDTGFDEVYQDTNIAFVTYNKNGLFSVKRTYEWYMGGVREIGTSGYVFDLNTGDICSIGDLITDRDENQLYGELTQKIVNCVSERDGSQTPEETRKNLHENFPVLNALPFYVSEEGEIVLCFYEGYLTFSCEGDFVISTGLFVNA